MLDVLLVEDEEDVRICIASWLEDAGHRVTQASDGGHAATLLESRTFDVAIFDVHLPTIDGLTLARRARHVTPGTAVVIMTSQANVADVVSSLRDGVLDYVVKPFDADRLIERIIVPIAERRAFRRQFEAARVEWINVAVGIRVVATSMQMKAVVDRVKAVAQGDSSVLLYGENGTGKKTLARLLHEASPRRLAPFVVVPWATLADLIVESELRALDGVGDRDAWFRQAEGGTLVLDGIDQAPLSVQAALARVLAEPSSTARRGTDWQPRGVRVVATARTDLSANVKSGAFLEALFYLSAAAGIEVAPLRERKADLMPLVAGILSSLAPGWASIPSIEPGAYAALAAYSFPGNVSELDWALRYAFSQAGTAPIAVTHLPQRIWHGERDAGAD
jgi:DNA-binding NtrC family response regulator